MLSDFEGKEKGQWPVGIIKDLCFFVTSYNVHRNRGTSASMRRETAAENLDEPLI